MMMEIGRLSSFEGLFDGSCAAPLRTAFQSVKINNRSVSYHDDDARDRDRE